MSFVKDFFLGSKGTPATVQDVSSNMDRYIRQNTGESINHYLTSPFALPTFGGQTTAGLSDGEQGMLGALNSLVSGPGSLLSSGAGVVRDLSGAGAFSPLVRNPALGGAGMNLAEQILTGKTMNPETDALLQRAIATAQRPIQEQFADDLAASRSAFTRAGQTITPKASSPFELAKTKLQTGLANALGDVATNISFSNLMNERGRQDNLLGAQINAVESGKNRQLATIPQTRGVIDSLTSAMNTMALPRLIEQQGIDTGIDQFNRQQTNFMSLLQNAFGMTAPKTVSIPGQEGSSGFLGAVLPAVATAFGGPIGGALAGAVLGSK